MRKTIPGLVLAATIALMASVVGASAGAAGGSGGGGGGGLEGLEVEFKVTSKAAPTACVSYYETTKKGGPAKHFDRVSNELVDLPFTTTVGTTSKAKHWAIAAWATDDCASTADPDGTVRCRIRIDGKRKARASGSDAIAFCFA
jgi:hypothetical protein